MTLALRSTSTLAFFLGCASITLATPVANAQAAATMPKATTGYSIRVFAQGGKYKAPDSIATYDGHVFVGYGDGNLPDGSDGKNTEVVQYNLAGAVEWVYKVPGHNDGLKIDPYQHYVWALQNEDSNSNAVAINFTTHQQSQFTFAGGTTAHGGGYDDIVFRAGKVYLSASNPSNNPNTGPAIVEATVSGSTISVTPVFAGNAQAKNVLTGEWTTLNLQDPDSMTLDGNGDLVLTSQADGELIVVRHPGAKNQSALLIPLSSPYGTPMVDDTLFTPNADGFILVADKAANTVYAITKTAFTPGSAYSAAQAPGTGTTQAFVGRLDMEFGQLTPVVTGMGNPGGMAFVKTNKDDSVLEEVLDFCSAVTSYANHQ